MPALALHDAVLGILRPGERVQLIYGTSPEERQVRLTWSLAAQTAAETEDAAVFRARALAEDLAVALAGGFPGCRFVPASHRREPDRLGGTVRLRPAGIRLSRRHHRSVGFGEARPTLPGGAVLIAADEGPADGSSLDRLLRSMLALAEPVRLTVSLQPFRLTADEKATILDTRQALLAAGSGHASLQLSDGARDSLLRSLDRWASVGRGVRVTCDLQVAGHVPEGLARLAAETIWPGVDAEVLPAQDTLRGPQAMDDPTAPESDLDLVEATPDGRMLNRLLPSLSLLLEQGVPSELAQGPLRLPDRGVTIGKVRAGRGTEIVRFSPEDRARHCYVCGQTGTGKSTLLYNMIRQDIEVGAGVCVVDPHGDLFEQVLESIPRHRADDVLIVDPTDVEHAVTINFLQCAGISRDVEMNFISNELITIFDRLYDLRHTGGPIFEQYMRNALLLVMESDQCEGTLMDIPLLFEDSDFRHHLVARCRNPLVVSFWVHQADRARGDASLANVAPYVTSKLNQFTSNALLRPIIGHPESTVDFRAAMDGGRIILVNLASGLLGELDTRLLGMLIVGKIYAAAMGRARIPIQSRRPFQLYVDEFQEFTTDTLAFMLAGARKFGLCLTLANQNLSQLQANAGKQNLLDAVLGNCGTLVCFRLGVTDASRLESYTMPELSSRHLQDIPDFHATTRLLAANHPLRPFVMATLPPDRPSNSARASDVAAASRGRFTRRRDEVEARILRRRSAHRDTATPQDPADSTARAPSSASPADVAAAPASDPAPLPNDADESSASAQIAAPEN